MYSREDVVKLLLSKRGVDPYATGGVRINNFIFVKKRCSDFGIKIIIVKFKTIF